MPTLEDACTILRVLARSATGQEITTYTTLTTGAPPRWRPGRALRLSRRAHRQWAERDAWRRLPRHAPLHPLRGVPQPLPGDGTIGGHAYGSLYPGPMGGTDADTPGHQRRPPSSQRLELLRPLRGGLPHGHSAAGADAAVARARFCEGQPAAQERLLLKAWAFAAKRPQLYHALTLHAGAAASMGGGATRALPLASPARELDGRPRPPCPARQDLPTALRGQEAHAVRSETARAHDPLAHPRLPLASRCTTRGAKLSAAPARDASTRNDSWSGLSGWHGERGAVQGDAHEPRRGCDPRHGTRGGGQRHRRLA